MSLAGPESASDSFGNVFLLGWGQVIQINTLEKTIIHNLLHDLLLYVKGIGLGSTDERTQTGLMIKRTHLGRSGRRTSRRSRTAMIRAMIEISGSIRVSITPPPVSPVRVCREAARRISAVGTLALNIL